MKHLLTIICGLLLGFSVWAGTEKGIDPLKKQTLALRVETAIKIDGQLDESDWQLAAPAADFVQLQPNPGKPATQLTDVRVLYDDAALYIGVRLFDLDPDSILQEMTDRDQLGNTDYFGVLIDAYQDGLNGLGFFVTPAGIQFDTKYSALTGSGGDTNWDAVWDSQARISAEGWVVEMKIPYSAIRFPQQEEQVWNVNFVRQIRRHREEVYWSEVDPEVNGLLNQSGQLSGIREVRSPVRLSATPFMAVYVENVHDQHSTPHNSWGRSFNGGVDLKYGINDAFTLDMTLVPDFGEARSDNQVLNLSPFEVRFDENRQFFTEGVELFNKGNLFYSRRIGSEPLHYSDVEDRLAEGDSLLTNPLETQLLNATKVSGRTKGGLGVGVFNALAGRTHARYLEAGSGEERLLQTNPLTNYNVLVLDQNLKNNSYVTLLNTNVWREGGDYDANVSGAVFNFRNKENSYELGGKAVLSQLYEPGDTELGHSYNLYFGKTSGQWLWSFSYNVESDTYDINDLGFLYNNNERLFSGNLNFNQYEPFGNFNNGGFGLWMGYGRLYSPNDYASFSINTWGWLVNRNFFAFGLWTDHQPFATFDYFEPRTPGRYYRFPTNHNFGLWFSTDYRKKWALDMESNYREYAEDGRHRFNVWFSPRFRVSDRLTLRLSLNSYNFFNDVGFVDKVGENETIVFGRRDQRIVENTLNVSYTFTNRMILTFRLRHYWSGVKYDSFHELQTDGNLGPTSFDDYNDNSFNSFNIDAVYRWRFAPGSDLFIVWKNSVLDYADEPSRVQGAYFGSIGQLTDLPQHNSLSIKLIYYLDYLDIVSRL